MKTKTTHNFHLPLPREIYSRLREASKRRSLPATVLARTAIDEWLKQQEKEELDRRIEAYARGMAGTECDLDEDLESAAVEHLLEMEEE